MTFDKAVETLTGYWAGCQDAAGLVLALQVMGAIKIDPDRRHALIKEAEAYRRPGGLIEVTPGNFSDACRLICEMADQLEKGK